METTAVQQEILLVKNSLFCRRLLFEKDAPENGRHIPYDEQLEMACWNGWLDTVLPEIINTSNSGDRLYTWEIMQAKILLNIELCNHPQPIDVQYSINPYAVVATVSYE